LQLKSNRGSFRNFLKIEIEKITEDSQEGATSFKLFLIPLANFLNQISLPFPSTFNLQAHLLDNLT
jgi:hypothetical protein